MYKKVAPWIRKHSNNFDVTMGSYDWDEVCQIIGIFILSLIGNKYNPNNIGLYRDDGLNMQQAHNLKKLKRLFKECLRTKDYISS